MSAVSAGVIVVNAYFMWSSIMPQLSDYCLLGALLLYAVVYVCMCGYLILHMLANMATEHSLSQHLLRKTFWTNQEMQYWNECHEAKSYLSEKCEN